MSDSTWISDSIKLFFPAILAALAVLYQVERNARVIAERKLKEARSNEYQKVIDLLFSFQLELEAQKALAPERVSYYQKEIFRNSKHKLMFLAGDDVLFAYLDLLDWWSGKTRSNEALQNSIVFAREFLDHHAALVLSMRKELGISGRKISRKVIMERIFGDRKGLESEAGKNFDLKHVDSNEERAGQI